MFRDLLKRLFGPKLFGPKMLADPYPNYARLRSADPVHWADQFGGWVLTRYADVIAVLRSPDASSERIAAARQLVGPEFQGLCDLRSHMMLNADPPRHTRLRLLVNKAFTPRTVEELAPFIRTFVDRVLVAAQGRGRMDVMGDLAFPLPATVIAEMLGVPPEDRDRFKQWSDDSTAGVANVLVNLPPGVLRKSIVAVEQYKGAEMNAMVNAGAITATSMVSGALYDEVWNKIIGYYTLSATSIALVDLPREIAKKLPRYPVVPAALMGRLAVDQSLHGQRLGEYLLMDAFNRCLRSEIASFAFVVDAKDDQAVAFYERYSFRRLTAAGRRLFLPMSEIASLLD